MTFQLTRQAGWLPRFNTYTQLISHGSGFTWNSAAVNSPSARSRGAYNCMTFACGGVEALTGLNPYDLFAAHLSYTDEASAVACIQSVFDVPTLDALLGLFFIPKMKSLGSVGDIALVRASPVDGAPLAAGLLWPPFVLVPGDSEAAPLQKLNLNKLEVVLDPLSFTVPAEYKKLVPSDNIFSQ